MEKVYDVVLDTDAYNEIDDQFAIAYLFRNRDRCRIQALYSAPFKNEKADSPALGMEMSLQEIHHLLELLGEEKPVFAGSRAYLPDEQTPVDSPAARDLAQRAMAYSPEEPLQVIAIGAITNVASAVLLNPRILDRIRVIWLGGHALHWPHTREFNMVQDIAAARVVLKRCKDTVLLPCKGVVSEFRVSRAELEKHLLGKNPLCTYLARHTLEEMAAKGDAPWSRVIWDVTAVAWLLGGFMEDRVIPVPIPAYDGLYEDTPGENRVRYVWCIHRDKLVADLFKKL